MDKTIAERITKEDKLRVKMAGFRKCAPGRIGSLAGSNEAPPKLRSVRVAIGALIYVVSRNLAYEPCATLAFQTDDWSNG
jgi:hypothetical protein